MIHELLRPAYERMLCTSPVFTFVHQIVLLTIETDVSGCVIGQFTVVSDCSIQYEVRSLFLVFFLQSHCCYSIVHKDTHIFTRDEMQYSSKHM